MGDRADPGGACRPRRCGQWRPIPVFARRGRRPTGSTRGRWRGCWRPASSTPSGRRISGRACCAGGWRGARSWCAPARARRTRSMPCSCGGWSLARRCLICSASRGACGCARSSSRSRSQRRSRRACATSRTFLDCEIAAVEREIARQALESPELRRLLTVPGVNVICAARFPGRGGRHPPLFDIAQAGRLPRA